jgi:glycosyltransferase involved in cell wall biosynthesis
MKILILTDLYPPYFQGGYEVNCYNNVQELLKRGHEIFILTSRWGIERPRVEGNIYRLLNYDRFLLGSQPRQQTYGPWRIRRRWNQLERALSLGKNYRIAQSLMKSLRPDAVFVWNTEHISVRPALAGQDQQIPIIFRVEDYGLARLRTELCYESNPVKRRYREAIAGLRFCRFNPNHLLVTSNGLKQCYVQAGFSANNIQVIPEGVPSSLLVQESDLSFLPKDSQAAEIRLLFAGRLVKEKGPDVAIQALACLLGKYPMCHARLDIIGAGADSYLAELKTMVHALGLVSQVTFVGKMDHEQLLEHYERYHALLFTSRWAEPFGVTVLEAMARGLPVVATNRGGPAEVISDGENGLLVTSDDPKILAEEVKHLVQKPELAQKIRYTALRIVREKYVLERIVDQVESILGMACRQRPLPI